MSRERRELTTASDICWPLYLQSTGAGVSTLSIHRDSDQQSQYRWCIGVGCFYPVTPSCPSSSNAHKNRNKILLTSPRPKHSISHILGSLSSLWEAESLGFSREAWSSLPPQFAMSDAGGEREARLIIIVIFSNIIITLSSSQWEILQTRPGETYSK